jgi:hypothetical protein
MSRRTTTLVASALAAALGLVGCSSPADPSGELDFDGLLRALRQDGLPAEPAGTLSQPFISVPARLITTGAEQIQVFEYSSGAGAQADAGQISPDGSRVGTSFISWIGPPHFYRRGRLLVLYVGDNGTIKASLERNLGPQFAGR